MSSFIYFAIICLFIIIPVVKGFSLSEWLLIKRTFKKNKPIKISDVKEGQAGVIKGYVKLLGATVSTPITETTAAYCKTRVIRSGTLLFEETKKGDIILYDGTAYCYIKSTRIIKKLSKARNFEYNHRNFYKENMSALIKKNGFDPDASIGSKYNRISVREEFLTEEDEIYVFGKGEWKKTKEFSWLKIPDEKFLYLVSGKNDAVLITDSAK